MQIRVAVEDSRSAGDLIRLLLVEFDAACVSFDGECRKVRIAPADDAERALVRALDVIEEWVTVREGSPATVEIEERSYTLGASGARGVGH
jgi:hypothetical protein